MLDENLKVLSRRMNDLEIELVDYKEKAGNLQRVNAETEAKLENIYDE